MNPREKELRDIYAAMDSEELTQRTRSGNLTEFAQKIAIEELVSRGINDSSSPSEAFLCDTRLAEPKLSKDSRLLLILFCGAALTVGIGYLLESVIGVPSRVVSIWVLIAGGTTAFLAYRCLFTK